MAVAELLVTEVLAALGERARDRMRAIDGSAAALHLY